MQAATVARVAFLLALFLSSVTAYLAFIRPVSVPLDQAGAGLDHCGYVLYVLHQGPRPDSSRDSEPPCEQPREDAIRLLGLVAATNSGLLVAGIGYGARSWQKQSRQ